jgi:hypothetical protein
MRQRLENNPSRNMSNKDFVNSVMNDDTDLKTSLQQYFHEHDLSSSPFNLFTPINSPYVDLEDITDYIPGDNSNYNRTLHINIRSLPSKIDKLKDMLAQLKEKNIKFDYILLCETFLKDDTAYLFNIPGYKLVSKNRKTNEQRWCSYVCKQQHYF